MEKQLRNPLAEIVMMCLEDKYLKNEVMLDFHCFVRVISGEVKVVSADNSQVFGPGDTMLFPRRQLSAIIHSPPFKGVLIILRSEHLKDYYTRHRPNETVAKVPVVRSYEKHPLIESYFASLLPYFDLQSDLPQELAALKVE